MPRIGDPCPAFALPDVAGKVVRRDDLFAGARAVVIAFSCNHCPAVRAYEDRMIALARETAPRGVAWALVNANDAVSYPDDSPAQMRKRAKAKGYPFPYLHDETQEVARAFDAACTPEFFLFDASRRLAYHGRLDDQQDAARVKRRYLLEAIDAVLAGRAPETAETHAIGCSIKWR